MRYHPLANLISNIALAGILVAFWLVVFTSQNLYLLGTLYLMGNLFPAYILLNRGNDYQNIRFWWIIVISIIIFWPITAIIWFTTAIIVAIFYGHEIRDKIVIFLIFMIGNCLDND